eukprot:3168891-Amphidinium_carterae.1
MVSTLDVLELPFYILAPLWSCTALSPSILLLRTCERSCSNGIHWSAGLAGKLPLGSKGFCD